jgi:cytochrome c556
MEQLMRLNGRWTGTAVALGVGLAVAAGGAVAQGAGAKAVKARQDGFKQMGAAFKTLNDELKSGKPDLGKIRASTQTMQTLSTKVPTWFPAGSGPQPVVKTKAKGDIWSDPAGFQAASKPLSPAAAKLNAAAKAGDLAAVGAAFKEAGAACGGCHDKFREKS